MVMFLERADLISAAVTGDIDCCFEVVSGCLAAAFLSVL